MKSLYIHIPFCKHKCFYCDFNSFSGKESLIEDYIEALKKELLLVMEENNEFKTVYFGGGTPSVIPANYIESILKIIKCNGEITLELNPGTIDEEKLLIYKKAGINRLSIGLQATQNNLLKGIGRIHDLKEFEYAFKVARKVGFNNISVDLMFGLPNQTIEDVKNSLDYLIDLSPEHISCYSLILHDEQKNKYPNVFINLPSDEQEREMYYLICEKLKEAGYVQYEISNFAKQGYESKHNMCYWNQDEYYGIGAGASSYVDNIRYKNVDSIEEYIALVKDEQKNKNLYDKLHIVEEMQTEELKLKEYMILRLRLLKGVSVREAKEIFKVDILEVFNKEIVKLTKMGLLEVKNEKSGELHDKTEKNSTLKIDNLFIKLTSKGLDLANIVWEEFI